MGEIIQEEKQEKGRRKKPKKQSTHIDMTPMVDLMCLLITFFMLTTAFSKPKVMEITMPEKKTDEKQQDTKVNEQRVVNIIMIGDDKVYWYSGMADPKKPPLPTLIKTDYSKDGIRKVLLQKNKTVFEKILSVTDEYKSGSLKITTDYIDSTKAQLLRTAYSDAVKLGKTEIDVAEKKNIEKQISEMQEKFKIGDNEFKKDFLAWKIKQIKKYADKKSPIVLIKADNKAKYKNIVDIIDEMAICNIASYAVVDISDVELEMLASVQ